MIIEHEQRYVESEGILKKFHFSITTKSISHLLSAFRSGIYSRKFYAVIREYYTNAQDANTAVGNPGRQALVHIQNISSYIKIIKYIKQFQCL